MCRFIVSDIKSEVSAALHYLLVTGPVLWCAISTPAAISRIESIVHIAISVLPDTHLQVKHMRNMFIYENMYLTN